MDTPNVSRCIERLKEARGRTLDLIADLDDEQMIGPRLEIVNPLRWEIGHVAWFQEYWLLRYLHGRTPILADGDSLYDSANVAHETRWDLPLPSKAKTISYTQKVLERLLGQYDQAIARSSDNASGLTNDAVYFLSLQLFVNQPLSPPESQSSNHRSSNRNGSLPPYSQQSSGAKIS